MRAGCRGGRSEWGFSCRSRVLTMIVMDRLKDMWDLDGQYCMAREKKVYVSLFASGWLDVSALGGFIIYAEAFIVPNIRIYRPLCSLF